MNILLLGVVTVLLVVPAMAQTSGTPPTAVAASAMSHGALQAEQARDDAAIQRQRDQIESLTRQMQSVKAQLDSLRRQLGEDSAITDQLGDRANQVSKQKYGVRVQR